MGKEPRYRCALQTSDGRRYSLMWFVPLGPGAGGLVLRVMVLRGGGRLRVGASWEVPGHGLPPHQGLIQLLPEQVITKKATLL